MGFGFGLRSSNLSDSVRQRAGLILLMNGASVVLPQFPKTASPDSWLRPCLRWLFGWCHLMSGSGCEEWRTS